MIHLRTESMIVRVFTVQNAKKEDIWAFFNVLGKQVDYFLLKRKTCPSKRGVETLKRRGMNYKSHQRVWHTSVTVLSNISSFCTEKLKSKGRHRHNDPLNTPLQWCNVQLKNRIGHVTRNLLSISGSSRLIEIRHVQHKTRGPGPARETISCGSPALTEM